MAKKKNRREKRLERKNKQTAKLIPKNMSASELDDAKNELDDIVHEANRRLAILERSGLQSKAYNTVAEESKNALYDENGKEIYRFDLDSVTTREELIKEKLRMEVFIADKGSLIPGARIDDALLRGENWKGQFGGEYKGTHYNSEMIDSGVAERAFKAYRMVESEYASEIASYGSENLITYLYDLEFEYKDNYYEEDLNPFSYKDARLMIKTRYHLNNPNDEFNKVKEQLDSAPLMKAKRIDNITGGRNW